MLFERPDPETVARFWSRVDRSSSGSCWIWTGAVRVWKEPWDGGYGAFWYQYRMVRAHIFSWWAERGPVPDGQVLRHFCQNRRCVNVWLHIAPGTQKQNVKDIIDSGRFKVFGRRYPVGNLL